MVSNSPPFTIGVEEEYLLVDKETRRLVIDPPQSLMEEAEERCGAQVTSELLRSQIEIGTKVCENVQEAREDLQRLRRIIIDVAAGYGYAPIAASTHPFGRWSEQKQTEKDRYNELTVEMQAAARRLLICGSVKTSCASTL
jgi:carboxylate-amine ligase